MSYRQLSIPDDELLQHYRAGVSTYRLAKQYQCHHTTIRARLLKLGEPLRGMSRKLANLPRAELEQLVQGERMSDGAIGDKYGVSATTIRTLRLYHGITSPRARRRRARGTRREEEARPA
ncbi:MAG: hypothetical protein OHK0022_18170 [Roseiflexaceae bacterium]